MEATRAKTVNRAATAHPAAAPQIVQRRPAGPSALRVQASSLRVSSPSDPAEKEADATAKKVMRMAIPEGSIAYVRGERGGVFRQVDDRKKKEEEKKEKLPGGKRIQRRLESPYLARFVQRKAEGQPNVASNVAADIQNSTSSGAPLPLSVRRFMEPRFRADFGGVKVHTGEKAAKLNRQLNARAFAVGNQLFFGRDQFRPESHEGR
ncbi:MAG: DUF4157 domain-containing protein, partial [Gemmatimonadetes bacterium]|nr:DUF4157 domain-containing protein [Gemmatimonadota bacterium]